MHSKIIAPALLALLGSSLRLTLHAQSPASSAKDQVVVMDPFTIASASVGPYQSAEALSGGRIRTDLFTSTENISVLTQAFMQDIGNNDIASAMFYLAGVSNNSAQTTTDRISVRGFQSANPDVDGMVTPATYTKFDPALFETIELVRGANSVIAPSGNPGGNIDLISKTARFANFGSITGEAGRYDTADRGIVDFNRTLGSNLAYRFVGSYQRSDQGDNAGYHRSLSLMPSVLWQLGPNTTLLFHFTEIWAWGYTYLGWPIDPSVSDTTSFKLLNGLNPYQTPYADNFDDPSARRHNNRSVYRTELKTRVSDNFSIRVAARYLWDWETSNQWSINGNAGGAYNPLTGYWVPGTAYGSTAPFAASPAPAVTANYTLSQTPTNNHDHYFDLQNDYVYTYKSRWVNSELTAGIGAEDYRDNIVGWSATPSGPINIFAIPATATWTPAKAPSTDQYVSGSYFQAYFNEIAKFWNDRIIVNGGVAPTWYAQTVANYLAGLTYTTSSHPAFANYGVAFVPIPNVSLFYSHSENAAYIQQAPTAAAPTPPEVQAGKDDDEGIRIRLLNGRALLTVTHYELYQTNNPIINPANSTIPAPAVALPNLLVDRHARGWEYELNVPVTAELSLVANYTNYRDRTPYGVPLRGEAENSGAAFVHYTFSQGALKGLGLGVGYRHQGKAPGESITGVTAASTPAHQIPQQPSFYIPAYGLWNLTASYQYGQHWTIRAFLDNATNVVYYAGGQSRNSVLPGIPINPRGSVTFSF